MSSYQSSNVFPLADLPCELLDIVLSHSEQSASFSLMLVSRHYHDAARRRLHKHIVISRELLGTRNGISQGRTLNLLQAVLREPGLLNGTKSINIQEPCKGFTVSEPLLNDIMADALSLGVRRIVEFDPEWQAKAIFPNPITWASPQSARPGDARRTLYFLVIELLLLKMPRLGSFALESSVFNYDKSLFDAAPLSIQQNLVRFLPRLESLSLSTLEDTCPPNLSTFQTFQLYLPGIKKLTLGERRKYSHQMVSFGPFPFDQFSSIKTLSLNCRDIARNVGSLSYLFPSLTDLSISTAGDLSIPGGDYLNPFLVERWPREYTLGKQIYSTARTRDWFDAALPLHRRLRRLHIYNPTHVSPRTDREYIVQKVKERGFFPNIETLAISENTAIIKLEQGSFFENLSTSLSPAVRSRTPDAQTW